MRLDDIFAIMLDEARLVTRGSDAARIEAQRIAGERGSRAAMNALAVKDQLWIEAQRIAGERRSRAATNALAVADQPVAAAAQAAERTPARPRRWLKVAFVRR